MSPHLTSRDGLSGFVNRNISRDGRTGTPYARGAPSGMESRMGTEVNGENIWCDKEPATEHEGSCINNNAGPDAQDSFIHMDGLGGIVQDA